MKIKIHVLDILLGIALGTGYLTSLRFLGLIGYSELLFFIVSLLLFKKNYKKIFTFPNNIEAFIQTYFLFSTLLTLPIITLITLTLNNIEEPAPIYILSFAFGVLLSILILEGIRSKQIDISAITLWFAFTFILTNLISIYIFNLDSDEERYVGGANNPNQLLFYASTLSLLLVIYHKKKSLLVFPAIIFIMLKTKSDAYNLSLAVVVGVFFYLKIFSFLNKKSISKKIITNIIILIPALVLTIHFYSEELLDLWLSADEGDRRRDLMWNGIVVSLQSPLFGWGAGSFSGYIAPFQGSEAHNTFLDLSMSFGLLFPIIIYAIFFTTLIKSIKNNDHLVSAFIVGFILSGLFHFSGRHFTFWIEIAVFMNYLFPKYEISSKDKTTKCAASLVY